MAFYSQDVWNQLKAITADDLIAALRADGYRKDPASRDATIAYIKDGYPKSSRIVIHYHPAKTYRPKLLKALLADAGWTTEDALVRVGLITRKPTMPVVNMVTVPCGCDGGLLATGQPCPEGGGTRFKEVPAPPAP